MDFLKLAEKTFNKITKQGEHKEESNEGGFHIPSAIHEAIDKFLDEKIKGDIQPKIISHVKIFQSDFLNSLEQKVYDAFDHTVDLDDQKTRDVTVNPAQSNTKERGLGKFFKEIGGMLADEVEEKIEEIFNPQEAAKKYIPQLKAKMVVELNNSHDGLAERFCTFVIEHMKQYIKNSLTKKDLFQHDFGDIISDVFGKNKHKSREIEDGDVKSRELDFESDEKSRDLNFDNDGDKSRGFKFESALKKGVAFLEKLFMTKLQQGLDAIEGKSKEYLLGELAKAQKALWEALPDDIQGPLESLLKDDNENVRDFSDEIREFFQKLFDKLQKRIEDISKEIIEEGHRLLHDRAIKTVEDSIKREIDDKLDDILD
ncbi:hypothetical protein HK096_006425 [Nowakowskiella sp. JEL0078]|nr:hypothetical protein HK096_006425 [Nowakowskiella sp. JEL0078]